MNSNNSRLHDIFIFKNTRCLKSQSLVPNKPWFYMWRLLNQIIFNSHCIQICDNCHKHEYQKVMSIENCFNYQRQPIQVVSHMNPVSWDTLPCISVYSESKFNKFEPRLKSAKNRFHHLSPGLNLETLNTILSETNHNWVASQN